MNRPDFQYRLDDVLLDVWADTHNGRATIECVAVAGTQVDLQNILSREQIEQIRCCADEFIAA